MENADTSSDLVEAIDPDPLTIILELANLIIQPGSLALLASSVGAVAAVAQLRKMSESQRSKVRQKLYEIDRALEDGSKASNILASLLDEHQLLGRPVIIGGAPVRGFTNAQRIRRAHEDCRAAVKDTRDAFIDLSGLLPADFSERIVRTLTDLNHEYAALVMTGETSSYARSLLAANRAMSAIDAFICDIGREFDYRRVPRAFADELLRTFPFMRL